MEDFHLKGENTQFIKMDENNFHVPNKKRISLMKTTSERQFFFVKQNKILHIIYTDFCI